MIRFSESGRIKVDEQRKQYDFEIKGAKVFATCSPVLGVYTFLNIRGIGCNCGAGADGVGAVVGAVGGIVGCC